MSAPSNIVHLRQNYQMKVVLSHVKPPIWRRLVIDSRIPLDALHDVIQISMGWTDSHMHQFVDRNGVVYSESYGDDFAPSLGGKIIDESAVLLNELLKEEKDWIKYEYDFGDGWEHKVILEKIIPHKKSQFPIICTKGRRACPPEDCGGPWGYTHLLEQLAAPENEEEYEDLMDWLGSDFEPEIFDLQETNQVLEELFDGVIFNGKSGLDKELKRIESEHDQSVDDLGLEGFGLEGMSLKDLGLNDIGLNDAGLKDIGLNQSDFGESDFDESDLNALNLGLTGLEGATNKLLQDPELPSEIKQLLSGMQEAVEVISYMNEMIEESIEAFEEIISLSKDKKITAIARKMLKSLQVE